MSGKLTEREMMLDQVVREGLPASEYRKTWFTHVGFPHWMVPWIRKRFLEKLNLANPSPK